MYFKIYGVTLFCPNIQPVPGSQIVENTLKKKVREKSAGREKGKRKGERTAPALPSFLQFYFDYLGACLLDTNHTKIKTRNSRLGEFYFFQLISLFLSSTDDISFRHELGSAHVQFDRLNEQSKLNKYQVRHIKSPCAYTSFYGLLGFASNCNRTENARQAMQEIADREGIAQFTSARSQQHRIFSKATSAKSRKAKDDFFSFLFFLFCFVLLFFSFFLVFVSILTE